MKNNIVNGTVSITVNRVITYVISYNYAKIEVDLHDSLPQKKKNNDNFDRIEISEGIGVNKTSKWKQWDICYYWYFLDKGLKFQPDVCSRCHGVLMMSMNLSDITFIKIQGADYRCIISGISAKYDKLNANCYYKL